MKQRTKAEEFVTFRQLQQLLAERREESRHAYCALVATCVYACAKAWLPDHPQHVSNAMLWMQLHAQTAQDADVTEFLERTLAMLDEIRPSYEPEVGLHLAN